MLLGNKERTVRLHSENFLWGNITFDYGLFEEEREILQTSSRDFAKELEQWAIADVDGDHNTDFYKNTTEKLYFWILKLRARGRIKGILRDEELESKINKLEAEKVDLENKMTELHEDNVKAVKIIKEQDRTIAGLESQIFYLKK